MQARARTHAQIHIFHPAIYQAVKKRARRKIMLSNIYKVVSQGYESGCRWGNFRACASSAALSPRLAFPRQKAKRQAAHRYIRRNNRNRNSPQGQRLRAPRVHAACKADVRSRHGARSVPTPYTNAAHCAELSPKPHTIRKMSDIKSGLLPQAKEKHHPFPPQLRAKRPISMPQRYKMHVFFVHLPCVTF